MKNQILKFLNIFGALICLITFPLSYENIIFVNAYKDFIVVIDPGHGGKDNGASYLDVYEDEINMDVGGYLYESCLKKGVDAFLTRTNDYDLASIYSKNRKNEDLKKRCEIINHMNAKVFISLHCNAYKDSKVKGTMIYYNKQNEASKALGTILQEKMNKYKNEDKHPLTSNFYLFRNCDVPGVLIELGFLTNDEERYKLVDKKYQISLAEVIFESIKDYYLNIK